MRKRNIKSRWIAILLAGVMLLTGCGNTAQEKVPELVEPMATNDAYRPVVKGNIGDIGNLEVLKGVVVPQEDCYFFNATATIDDVKVAVGDYVEAGTVLATIRLDELNTAIATLTDTIKNQKEIHEQQEKIFELTLEKYDYQIKAMKEAGDTDGMAELKKQRSIDEENHMFDELMYERQLKQYETELAEQKQLLADGELVARNAGYVTYVKNLAKDTDARVSENIVIVADYSKKYLEVWNSDGNLTMDDTGHMKAESVYTTTGGKRYELSLYEYSKDALAMMQFNKNYANIRYEIPAGIDVEVGDFLPVCYAKKNVSDVLIIGADSLYTEGNDNFVYVRTKDNGKERRDITIGESDEHYIEVTSGLSEGEEVYYSSLALMPANYKPVTVELSEYHKYAKTGKFELSDKVEFNLYAQEDMRIAEVLVAEGDTVKEGDLVLKVKADGGKADLIAAKDAIDAEEKAYKQLCKEYKQQMAEIENQIEEAARRQVELDQSESELVEQTGAGMQTELEADPAGDTQEDGSEAATESEGTDIPEDADTSEDETSEEPEQTVTADMLYQTEQLSCDKQIAAINHKIAVKQHEFAMKQLQEAYDSMKLANDGNGYRNIYADRDGVVTAVKAQADKKVAAGSVLYTIEQDSTKKLLVTMAPMTGEDAALVKNRLGAELNQTIQFKNKDQVSEGVCVAKQASSSKVYYTEIDGTVYSSTNADDASDNWQSNEQFYVAMKDASFYDNMAAEEIVFDSVVLKNMVVLPAAMVYTESDIIKNATYYYVWKIVNGELIKQYVTISQIVDDVTYVVIVAGVSEGDVLAKEIVVNQEEDATGEDTTGEDGTGEDSTQEASTGEAGTQEASTAGDSIQEASTGEAGTQEVSTGEAAGESTSDAGIASEAEEGN